ncbi:phage holin family protein [Chryseobacterium sp. T1]
MVELLKEYANKRISLIRLELTEKSSLSAGIITFIATLVTIFTFFIILFNFGIAYLIGEALQNTSYGFLTVSGFYLLLFLIAIIFRKKIIRSVADNVINFLKQ